MSSLWSWTFCSSTLWTILAMADHPESTPVTPSRVTAAAGSAGGSAGGWAGFDGRTGGGTRGVIGGGASPAGLCIVPFASEMLDVTLDVGNFGAVAMLILAAQEY